MNQKHNVTAEKLGIQISTGTLAGLAGGAITHIDTCRGLRRLTQRSRSLGPTGRTTIRGQLAPAEPRSKAADQARPSGRSTKS